jgi:hypothetical protein
MGLTIRVRKWLSWAGRPDIQMFVGGPVLVGLIAWRLTPPLRFWWAACLGLAMLMFAGHRVWRGAQTRRWNDRAVAAQRAGVLDTTPPPRASVLVPCAGLALSVAGLVLVIIDLLE